MDSRQHQNKKPLQSTDLQRLLLFSCRPTRSQQFARGGKVLSIDPTPLSSGLITASPNIPTQTNGDSVLATVKPGEVILNELQQKLLGGAITFKSIGVPGFTEGGQIPQVINPNSFFQANNSCGLVAKLDQKQIDQLANSIGKEAEAGARKGISEGLDDANRTAERNKFARKKGNLE